MKDGTVYYFDQVGSVWTVPQPRLRPEPAVEAQARKAAVASAQRNVVAKKYPQYANSTPDIGEYLVRITRADGAVTDVWVWPDLSSFDYGVRLDPVSK
jgi:hypothetical protein